MLECVNLYDRSGGGVYSKRIFEGNFVFFDVFDGIVGDSSFVIFEDGVDVDGFLGNWCLFFCLVFVFCRGGIG